MGHISKVCQLLLTSGLVSESDSLYIGFGEMISILNAKWLVYRAIRCVNLSVVEALIYRSSGVMVQIEKGAYSVGHSSVKGKVC